jgi:hypothetical protein
LLSEFNWSKNHFQALFHESTYHYGGLWSCIPPNNLTLFHPGICLLKCKLRVNIYILKNGHYNFYLKTRNNALEVKNVTNSVDDQIREGK